MENDVDASLSRLELSDFLRASSILEQPQDIGHDMFTEKLIYVISGS